MIGNPPWDRMKVQEVEWFAARKPAIAFAQRAADRKRLIEALRTGEEALWPAYETARDRAEAAVRVARSIGDYPLLSGGDVNIYALFVERARRLIKPEGMIGLLTPSGIASDKGAAPFFRSVSTTSRLRYLYDFENRGFFFPDVHRSFKFCVLIAGGKQREFPAARCAFFLHDPSEIDQTERSFSLSAEDFAAINPNTGTAPVFRTARDAELTRAIYARLPVLVDRRGTEPVAVWPVR